MPIKRLAERGSSQSRISTDPLQRPTRRVSHGASWLPHQRARLVRRADQLHARV